MTFEEKKQLAWAAAYGTAFAVRILEVETLSGEERAFDAKTRDRYQKLARKVADSAVKDLILGWNHGLEPV